MQAIETKWVQNYRIKATAARGSRTFSLPNMSDSDEDRHRWAARQLIDYFAALDARTYGDKPEKHSWGHAFVTGCLPNGNYAHVFTK